MKILIFDTETIGKINQDLLNVGYKIIDLNIQQGTYTTKLERDFVMTDLINNKVYCLNDDFVGATKYEKLINAIENKKATKRNIKYVIETLKRDIDKNQVLFAYAFNCKFDVDKFKRNGFEFPIPVFDIWAYAYQYITTTKEYKDFCLEHDFLTESKKYISGNVETLTRYLSGKIDFVEDHTALSDVQNETEILVECVKRGADITRALPAAKNVASGKVLTTTIKLPSGDKIDIEYTSTYERNGVVTYKL